MTDNFEEIIPMKWWERVKNVFVSPNKVFENLAHHPRVLFTIIAVPVVMILLLLLRINLYKEMMMDATIQQYTTQGLEIPPNMESMISIQAYISLFVIGITPLLVWLVKSSLIAGVAPVVGGDGSFKHSFAAISHAYLPVLLGGIISTIIGLIIGEFQVPMSLALVLPDSMSGNFFYLLLSQFDIFIIWYEVLAIIGISHAYNISKKKSAMLVLLTWLSWILITVGIGSISSALLGGM